MRGKAAGGPRLQTEAERPEETAASSSRPGRFGPSGMGWSYMAGLVAASGSWENLRFMAGGDQGCEIDGLSRFGDVDVSATELAKLGGAGVEFVRPGVEQEDRGGRGDVAEPTVDVGRVAVA